MPASTRGPTSAAPGVESGVESRVDVWSGLELGVAVSDGCEGGAASEVAEPAVSDVPVAVDSVDACALVRATPLFVDEQAVVDAMMITVRSVPPRRRPRRVPL